MRVALLYTDNDPWALGMRNLSAALKKAGHHTKLILIGSNKKRYSNRVLEQTKELVKDSDIIGISCLSRGSDKARQVIEYLHPLDKFIVWGGIHATLNPEACANSADIVCRGEGEGMMLELLERLQQGQQWKDIANAAYMDNGRIVVNPLRPLISDLDELPLIDFSCEDEFRLADRGFVRVSHISDETQRGEIIFMGARGCPLECTYCCNAKLKELFSGRGRYVRKTSMSKYIEHVKALRRSCPSGRYFLLIDDDFFARSVDELREFSKEFPRQVGLPFECVASPLHITPEKMDLLVNAGLWRIRMGVESGSERTKREVYRRSISNEAVMRAANIISRYPQVVAYYFFVIGNPYEQRKDLVETARFMLNLPIPYYTVTYNLVLFPGSVLYERAIRDRLIDGKQDSGYEIDFRSGLRYEGHTWKRKNLYLNGLLFLMEGKSSRHRLGALPRFLVPFLLHPKMVNFNDKHPVVIRCMIAIKMFTLSVRTCVARLLKLFIEDPTSVYDLRRFIKSKLKSICGNPASSI